MKRAQFASVARLLFAALLTSSCRDAATPLQPFDANVSPAFDVQPGPPVLDQRNGTLGFTGTDIRKGFNPHNPQLGDAIIATFIWQSSNPANLVTSVIDHLTNGTPVGNTYNLVEFKSAGGISMATYAALNVQNFPQGNPSNPNPNQDSILVVTATLSAPIANGGIMISAYRGVATVAALNGHASAGGTSSTTTTASTGPIAAGSDALVYSISMTSPNAAHQPPAELNEIINLSTFDGAVKIVGQWGVHAGVGTTDPQWTWFHTQPSSWLLTNITLLSNGGGQPPTTGNLTATTATTGSNLDPDGYTVIVDDSASQAIGVNGSVTFNGLSSGLHSVVLSGVAANCTVGGSNPRTVDVPAGGTATTAFSVDCRPTPPATGDLNVSASTSGSDADPDGYTVTVDGSNSQTVSINGSVTFAGLSEGNHTVSLSGAAANCAVSGDNPRTVAVTGGGTANTTFAVSCTALPPSTGDLTVSASTSGSDPDSEYLVIVDGSEQTVAANGSVTFAGLSQGSHTVALDGVAANCAVSGSNPRTVSVPGGGTASTTFSVSCVATTGALSVSTSTSGSSFDPNGYSVTINGGNARAIGVNDVTTYTNLTPGSYSVAISGVASNCTVSGANPRTISVTAGGTASTTFSITCVTPNTAPVVNAGPDQLVLVGLLYNLQWSFADPDNGPWSYTIDWGDGTYSSGTKTSAGSFTNGHTYGIFLLGQRTIRITVTDSQGASHTDTKVINVVL